MRTHSIAVCICATFAVVALCAATAAGQTGQADQPGSDNVSEVVTGEGTVGVDERPTDQRIEDRLREILAATERFSDLDVDVRGGVVFLRGVAESEESRDLAASLATRTEGVAAVVNDLSLPVRPVWTLEPAIGELDSLLREAIRAIPLLVAGVLVLVVVLIVARAFGVLAARLVAGTSESELIRNVVRKAAFLVVVILGVYLALRITGLTRVALTVVSGTGILGLALGFAFRDIAENFLASLLLSIQRPFRLGDVIEVDGHTGIVRKVTSRGTLLIDFEGNHIQIANATVYKNTIKNFSANPNQRLDFSVGIGYDDRITHAQELARDVLDAHPAVLGEPEPLVLVDNLGASTVNLRIYFWINGAEHSVLKMKSSVIRLVLRALAEAGISMPDEAREVVFPDGVPVLMRGEGTGAPRRESAEPPPRGRDEGSDESAAVIVEAEGDLTTETVDLERQAARSRDPEEGANVLEPDRTET